MEAGSHARVADGWGLVGALQIGLVFIGVVATGTAAAAPGARVSAGIGTEGYALPGRVDAVFRPVSPSIQADAVAVVGTGRALGTFGAMTGAWLHPGYRRGWLLCGTAGVEGWLSERVALEGRLAIGFLLDGWADEAFTFDDGEWNPGRGGGLPYGVVLPGLAVHVRLAGLSALYARYETGPMLPLHGFPGFLHVGYAWRSP